MVAAVGLAGCSAGSMMATIRPRPWAACPRAPRNASNKPSAYPAVHDMPPPRGSTVLTDAEQKKLEDDLIAARNRTASEAKPVGRPD